MTIQTECVNSHLYLLNKHYRQSFRLGNQSNFQLPHIKLVIAIGLIEKYIYVPI